MLKLLLLECSNYREENCLNYREFEWWEVKISKMHKSKIRVWEKHPWNLVYFLSNKIFKSLNSVFLFSFIYCKVSKLLKIGFDVTIWLNSVFGLLLELPCVYILLISKFKLYSNYFQTVFFTPSPYTFSF